MKPKHILIELPLLICLYLFTAIGIRYILALFLGRISSDISLHDTYFTTQPSWIYLTLFPFLLLTVLIYLLRAGITRFKKPVINIILIISNLLLVVTTLEIYQTVLLLEQIATPEGNGWAIYPPLSAAGKKTVTDLPAQQPHFDIYILALIIIFTLILAISSMLTGKNWKTNTHEQAISS